MLDEIKKLYETGILAPAGIYRLAASLLSSGVNPMALLTYAAKTAPEDLAITDEEECVTYRELHSQCERLAEVLQRQYHVTARQKVAILCRNHASIVRALFSVSCLGAHVYLLNVELSASQLGAIMKQQGFHLVIHDAELAEVIDTAGYVGRRIAAYGHEAATIVAMSHATRPHGVHRARRGRAGNIVVLTGGTTGDHKMAARKPGVMRFVSPFCALLVNAELAKYRSVYVATPIYHGYGLAAIFISILLRSHIYLQRKFDAANACRLIEQEQIEVTTVVPLMLHRMLGCNEYALRSLKCVITGGAAISPQLVRRTMNKLGPVLFNLYGTSEAGICMMATPADLIHAPDTVGKNIAGVQVRITNEQGAAVAANVIGSVCVKNSWSTTNARSTWVDTGDMGYRDEQGYVFLCGRADDMIVSGGENVYPMMVEHVLLQHDAIREAAVVGVPDEEFGQRSWAYVVPEEGADVQADEVRNWLRGRVARYELPAWIEVVDSLPYTPLGKPDRNKLRSYHDIMQ